MLLRSIAVEHNERRVHDEKSNKNGNKLPTSLLFIAYFSALNKCVIVFRNVSLDKFE